MRLPASLLGTLRVGLGATALMGGCDGSEPQATQGVLGPAVASVQIEAEETRPGLAAEVTALVERASAEASPIVDDVFAAADPVARELDEELTAFVPFAEDPAEAAPIRPRIRPRARPLPRPGTEPRPVESSQVRPWNATVTATPKWSEGGCPACGRG